VEGNVEKARLVLKAAQPMFDTDKFAEINMQLDMLGGNYQPYLASLLKAPDTLIEKEVTVKSAALEIAIIYLAEGKSAEAKKYFAMARDALEKDLQDLPGDFRILSPLAVAYAGLGERQKALEYGKSATELAPVSEDITIGVIPLENLALIHALLGEQDEAVDILEQVMKMPYTWYSSNTIPLLKMSPQWASLKNNQKFKKLVGGS
jgi:tetratricopeptide (TPR) repeat protein